MDPKSNTPLLSRLHIRRRLTLCFVLVIMLMLVGDSALLWQLRSIRAQVERLKAVDEELIEVQRVHSDLQLFYERLGVAARSEGSARVLQESEELRATLLDDAQRTQTVFSDLPPEVKVDETVLPTLESIERTLPSHLDAIRVLAGSGQWEAVRRRLELQVQPLESLSSELVTNVAREVGEQRAQAALNIAHAERQMFLGAALTGFITLLIAACLGLAVTRSITEPLGQLVEGSKALARGEFEHVVPVIGNDELGQLTLVFNETGGKLRELYDGLRKLASLVENSTDFIGMASLEGEVLFINRAGQTTVGLAGNEQVHGTRIPDYIAEQDLERFENQVLPVVFKDGRWEGETLFRQFKTGASISMWQHIFFIADERSGRRLALATICRDITERKRAEEASRLAQADLARVNRVMLLGEMAASIAHEVNQPLTGIVAHAGSCLRWLNAQPPEMEEARESLQLIVRDGNRAGEVIGRIRALVKKVPSGRDLLNINKAILEVIGLSQSELQRSSVELRTGLANDLPLVAGDRVQLQQVILNLIVNAVEAMSGVGDRARQLDVASGTSDSNDVFVEVRDSGPGLDLADLPRLFDSFYTTKSEGMGMGLSISRSIIEAHDGTLSAIPNQPHGAVFRFTLPVEVDKTP